MQNVYFLKKILLKLTKECTFSANGKLLKQIDGSPMGGPISVVFPDTYMCKMGFGVVVPTKFLFYKRYVNDTYVRRNLSDLEDLNLKILTVEVNLSTFLDKNLSKKKGLY